MRILLFVFTFSSLLAADHRISQSSRERHEEMLNYYSKPEEKRKPTDLWNRQYLMGNLGTARETLAKAGITIDAAYVTNLLSNVAGGKARGFAYTGSYGLSLNIDFTPAGLKDFHLFSSAVWRTGTNLSQRKIDNQFTVSQIYGSQTVRLNELYLLKYLWNKNITIKAGRLDAGNDFLANPLYWNYVNNAFNGNPVSIFFNIPFTAYPKSTWGAYFEIKPWKRLSAKFAAFNANSKIQKNKYHGINFTFKSTNGVVWISEWAALINQEKKDRGLPGTYKVGYYYLTGSLNKFSGGSQKGDPGLYFLFDQMIYRKGGPGSDRGLTPFISFIMQPENRNKFPFFTNGGLVYKGFFDTRPKDTASFGFIYGHYSSDLRESQKKKNEKPQYAETVLEFSYWAQINPWFYIMPDFQYIIHPKGRTTHPNAWVIGAQIGIDQW